MQNTAFWLYLPISQYIICSKGTSEIKSFSLSTGPTFVNSVLSYSYIVVGNTVVVLSIVQPTGRSQGHAKLSSNSNLTH